MTVLRFEDDNLVDDYLRGKLQKHALKAFEKRLLEDPALLKLVRRREAMIKALKAERKSLGTACAKRKDQMGGGTDHRNTGDS